MLHDVHSVPPPLLLRSSGTAVGESSMAQVRKLEKVNSTMNIHLMYTVDKDLVPDPIARAQDGSYQHRGFQFRVTMG